MSSKLSVLMGNKVVGHLWLNHKDLFNFQYDTTWLYSSNIPLSLSLPLREQVYANDESHAFFANLLPEGDIREAVARRLHISKENDFGILERIGGDCAGAISVLQTDKTQSDDESYYERKDDNELKQIILELPKRPLLAGEKGVRLSLAGAQKKLPVYYDNSYFYITYGGAPSTHIIKPPMSNLDNTVENEAFCMRLARHLGLPVPNVFIYELGEFNVFVVERYDRILDEGKVYRLHQEDFCQALNVLPSRKYEVENGPSFKECFNTVKAVSIHPAKDTMSLINWLIFNFLIGNSDNHGKNLSFLYLNEGPTLAPFYDLLSTKIYGHFGVEGNLAMTIGGETDPEKVQKRHWEGLAEDLNIKPQLVLKMIEDMCTAISDISIKMRKGEFKQYECDAIFRLVQTTNLHADKTYKKIR